MVIWIIFYLKTFIRSPTSYLCTSSVMLSWQSTFIMCTAKLNYRSIGKFPFVNFLQIHPYSFISDFSFTDLFPSKVKMPVWRHASAPILRLFTVFNFFSYIWTIFQNCWHPFTCFVVQKVLCSNEFGFICCAFRLVTAIFFWIKASISSDFFEHLSSCLDALHQILTQYHLFLLPILFL